MVGRVLGESLVPTVHLAQVGKTTLRKRTDQVERRGRRVVALDQPGRVGLSRLGDEVVAVDDVATVSGQGHVATGLEVARARLGELSGHPAHLHHRHRGTVGEHDGHLQHRLDPVADLLSVCSAERLGAVATLKQKGFASRRFREPLAQNVDFAGKNEGWLDGQFCGCRCHSVGVRPRRLLLDRESAPIVEARDHRFVCQYDWFGGVYH